MIFDRADARSNHWARSTSGKTCRPAATRRPFDLERIAPDSLDIDIDFGRKCRDRLSTALPDFAERNQVVGHLNAEFFQKFPAGDLLRIFAGAIFALWNRPGTDILVAPEGTARVNEQNLGHSLRPSERDNAGASWRHDAQRSSALALA
jgi:hypothetical protein